LRIHIENLGKQPLEQSGKDCVNERMRGQEKRPGKIPAIVVSDTVAQPYA
jgi:hypothetical protein